MATASGTITLVAEASSGFVTSTKPIDDLMQALVTAGVLTQSSDTGQVSWGSVSASNSTTTYYSIYKLNDSLNSTYPIYIKFSFVPNATTTQAPSTTVQVGTGSDGAGNLTGASGAVTFLHVYSSALEATARSVYASAGDGYLTLFGGVNTTNGGTSQAGCGFALERTRNTDGTINGDGIAFVGALNQANTSTSMATAGAGTTTVSIAATSPVIVHSCAALRGNLANLFTVSCDIWPPVMTRGSQYNQQNMFDGTNYLASAVQPFAGKLYPPMTSIQIGDSSFPEMSSLTLSLYGVSHNYQSLNRNLPAFLFWSASSAFSSNEGTALTRGYGLPFWRYE